METIAEHVAGHSQAPAPRERRSSKEERERQEREEREDELARLERDQVTEQGMNRALLFIAVALPLLLWASSLGDRMNT